MKTEDVPDDMMRAGLRAWFGDLEYKMNEYRSDQWWRHREAQIRRAVAAVWPLIAAQEREMCANVAEAFPARTHGAMATAPYAAAEQAADEIAAAIRALD